MLLRNEIINQLLQNSQNMYRDPSRAIEFFSLTVILYVSFKNFSIVTWKFLMGLSRLLESATVMCDKHHDGACRVSISRAKLLAA